MITDRPRRGARPARDDAGASAAAGHLGSARLGLVGLITLMLAHLAGCATPYLMGEPLSAERLAELKADAPSAPPTQSSASGRAEPGEWDKTWQQVQRAADSVDVNDHWKLCAIKLRFRKYGELFLCLDLMEQRVAKLDANNPQRKYAPVIAGWMRASAYSELGQFNEALKWAESAWSALPDEYFRLDSPKMSTLMDHDFGEFCLEAGGTTSSWSSDYMLTGRNNPAGLNMSPDAIAMGLASQRALLYQQTGRGDVAKDALQDLYKWRDASVNVAFIVPRMTAFHNEASMLSLGPLFAFGEYAQVVQVYEQTSARKDGHASTMRLLETVALLDPTNWAYQLVSRAVASMSNRREFAVAVEDSSNVLIYATSLSRLGQTDRAKAVLDGLIALPEIQQMGSIYWATLYERGQIALKEGKLEEAIKLLQQAADAIERVRQTINFEASKIGFAANKQAVYAALVKAQAEAGDWNGAFLAAERAKARALVDLLAQQRELAPPPAADGKVRELLARAEVSEAQLGLPVGEEAAATRGLTVAARSELAQVAPEAASLVSVQSVPVKDIASRLAADETLIDYYQTGDDLYALVMNGTTIKGFKLAAGGLDEEVRGFRQAIEERDDTVADRGRALYDRLVRPVAGDIPGRRLTISPHGILHYLPLGCPFNRSWRFASTGDLARIAPSWADVLVGSAAWAEQTLGSGSS